MEDLVGKSLGQFQITRELGRGGMAVVYAAYQPALQRQVALKVLPPNLSYDDAFVRRFQQEAIAAAGLRHPNIVTIYDVGSQDGYNYIVMEYLEGRPLSELVRGGGPMPLGRAIKILEQVAQALDYAHQRGFVHRDIKPSNVMVDQNDHATLTDFGIARALTDAHLTQTGAVIGTPEYMSPEQVMGEEVDGRTDIYSLGIVAYEMTTGQAPFSGTTASVLYKQAHTLPPPLHTHVPGVSPAVEDVILRALAKRREERYSTASQFVQALSAAAARPLPETVSALPPRQRPMRWLPWVLGGGAILAVACVAIFVIAFLAKRDGPAPQPITAPTRTTPISPTAPPDVTSLPTAIGGRVVSTPTPAAGGGRVTLTLTPRYGGPRLAYASGPEGGWRIMLADLSTGRVEPLPNQPANSGVPAWSPERERLAFRSNAGGAWQVYTMKANGTDLRQLTKAGNNREANWGPPDGEQLVYVSDRDGNKELYITDASGREHRRLTNNSALDDDPNWSRDGEWIAFERNENDCFNIYVIRPDGSDEYALTRNSGADCMWASTPAWSPDGDWIAYEQSTHGMGYRIAVMTAQGSNARLVTQGGTEGINDVRPAWSPDGKWIAFSSDRDGDDGIYIAPVSGGQPQRVDRGGGFDPAW